MRNEKIELLEQLYIAAHVIDEVGSILWSNPYEVNLLGYQAEEFIGHKFQEVSNYRFIFDIFICFDAFLCGFLACNNQNRCS